MPETNNIRLGKLYNACLFDDLTFPLHLSAGPPEYLLVEIALVMIDSLCSALITEGNSCYQVYCEYEIIYNLLTCHSPFTRVQCKLSLLVATLKYCLNLTAKRRQRVFISRTYT